jgi:DCN1-like protein 1/2
MTLCQDLGVELEDVVLLAVAYELKSPGVAEWTRKGWVDGWKALRRVQNFRLHAFV